jgi:hypothetical protein
MLSGNARAYPIEAPTHKHKIMLKRLGRDKPSSLLQKFATYGHEKVL